MSKYAPLARFLKQQPGTVTTLAFSQIEQLIGDALPPLARKFQQWLENESGPERHVQAQARLRAGWVVEQFSFPDETVTFRRSDVSSLSSWTPR